MLQRRLWLVFFSGLSLFLTSQRTFAQVDDPSSADADVGFVSLAPGSKTSQVDDGGAAVPASFSQEEAGPFAGPFRSPPDRAGLGVDRIAAGDKDDETKSKAKDPKSDELDKRLKKMEEKWKKFDDAELKKKLEAAKKPTVKIGGRIHADYVSFLNTTEGIDRFENPITGVDPEDRFLFRRIRLEMSGDVFENMLWRLQVDFADPGNPQLKDVYIGFKELPFNQSFLVGNQKRPLGLDHWNSSRFNIFMERPLVVEAFNQDARRPGACMYGYTDDESLFWQYGAYLLEDLQQDGQVVGDSYQGSVNARIGGSPWYDETSNGRGWMHLALAGMYARPDGDADPNDTNRNQAHFQARGEERSFARWLNTLPIPGATDFEIGAVEAMLNIGAIHFCGEYQSTWVQRRQQGRGTGPDVNFHGYYVQAAYFLTGESMQYERKNGSLARVEPFERFFLVERGAGWGAWQVAARWSYLDLTDGDIRGGVEHNITGGLNWYWNAHSKMQFNLIHGEIDQRFPVAGYTSGQFTALTARMQIDF